MDSIKMFSQPRLICFHEYFLKNEAKPLIHLLVIKKLKYIE